MEKINSFQNIKLFQPITMNKIKNKIIKMFLILLTLIFVGCGLDTDYKEVKIDINDIIVNANSKLIHLNTCGYIGMMNEENILHPQKEVEELIKEGCIPCERCLKKFYNKYIFGEYDNENIIATESVTDVENNEFVECIKDVAEWYLENVYTYQGAHKYKNEIEKMALKATKEAYSKWASIKNNYTDNEYVMEAASDKKSEEGKFLNNDALYLCKEINDINIKGNYVADDCSKFATAVYYYFLKKIGEDELANKLNIPYTGSFNYSKLSNKVIKLLTKDNIFEFYNWEMINEKIAKYNAGEENQTFELQAGDLLYRKEKRDNNGKLIKPGHVEFYLGKDMVFGWGNVQNVYGHNKCFQIGKNGFYSSDKFDMYDGEPQPYIAVVRFVGGK